MNTLRILAMVVAAACSLRSAAFSQEPASNSSQVSLGVKLVRLTTDGAFKHRPVWHPDGKRLLFASHENGGNSIFVRIAEVGNDASPQRLTRRKDPEYNAVVSPDGKLVLLTTVTLSGTQGNLDIAVMPLDGSAEPRTVAGDKDGKLSHQDWPAWLPDGKRFVFNSTHEGNQEIYLGHIDGKEPLERLTQSPGQDVHPAVSPDGSFLIFATDRWGGFELARLNIADKSITRLTESKGFDDYPAISPDGRRWVFVSNRSGNPDLWLADSDGRTLRLTESPEPELFPSFSMNGKSIVFVSGRHGAVDLYRLELP